MHYRGRRSRRRRQTAPANQLKRRKSEILEFLRTAGALARQQRAIVPLQPRGTRTPVFAVGGHNGDVFCYRALVQHLGEDQPFFGLQPPGVDGHGELLASVEEIAAYFAAQIRAFRPNSPYIIAGYCGGGTIAFELAQQLVQDGADISFLALVSKYARKHARVGVMGGAPPARRKMQRMLAPGLGA